MIASWQLNGDLRREGEREKRGEKEDEKMSGENRKDWKRDMDAYVW